MSKNNRDLHILVTRPKDQANYLLAALHKMGTTSVHLPLLSIEPAINADVQKKLHSIIECNAVICISQNAAQCGLNALDQSSIKPAAHLQWFAMGSGTAQVLQSYGLSVTTPNQFGTSEALLALPWFADVANKRVMIWKGVGGRELLEQTLRNQGAEVDCVELYQRVTPTYAPNALDQVLIENNINIIMITSGQALENLWQLAIDKMRIINTIVVVPSERVAQLAHQLGIRQVLCAGGADDQSMLQCLQEYQTQTVRSL